MLSKVCDFDGEHDNSFVTFCLDSNSHRNFSRVLLEVCNFLMTSLASNQYFVEAGGIAVRRVRKEDLCHVAKATGATAVKFSAWKL